MWPVVVAWSLACGAGVGRDALAAALQANASALVANDDPAWPLATWVGRVDAVETAALPPPLAAWDCRATRLAWLALQADGVFDAVMAARERCGPARVGVVLGTSASTIGVSEQAYRAPEARVADPLLRRFPPALADPRLSAPHALGAFVQQALRLDGPCLTVSTACSSSAKAFASAARWLQTGLADAVVVAGVDALCASLLYGFRALGLVAADPCRPFSAGRAGISIGEAAGFALLQREGDGPRLVGYGESNDAHHMSSPHPQGLGAELALDAALGRAGLNGDAIDFVNLHGTASDRNDAVEAALVARRYGEQVHACATKGLTGHTMGAAGIVEAAVCWLALERGLRAGSAHVDASDAAFGERFGRQLRLEPAHGAVRHAASHSFGFGGNNAVLVFA